MTRKADGMINFIERDAFMYNANGVGLPVRGVLGTARYFFSEMLKPGTKENHKEKMVPEVS